MTVLFDGQVDVAYAQVYLQGGADFASDLDLSFGGQRNGLCGAAHEGMLFLLTGSQDGTVPFRLELLSKEPAIDASWEEIVEAGFSPSAAVALCDWHGTAYPLAAIRPGTYRVRYCVSGMDRAHNPPEHGPAGDRYLLQLWPAAPGPDAIIKQTSEAADYAHRAIERIPIPPTPAERAAAAHHAQLMADEASREAMRRLDDRRWGGRPPSERQRAIRGNVLGIARLDRPLADAISETDADTQREIARWATRRAYDRAGLAERAWVAPALAAMDAGRPPPPPFDDITSAFERLHVESDIPGQAFATIVVGTSDDLIPAVEPTYAALPAFFAAAEADAAQAVFDALYAAVVTFGSRYVEFLTELRRAFPAVDISGE
ncbi:hypothetical protein [Nakamurella multipartita]|jgi:hypothetical protein|uniref:Uncharacterized protein n=1 Tax=Nakamurella multipartita (strain ATCC 700099 / DSM 44233 / CIP 104796 / JCM 9543 / NBRC 105858 / Y-104) TaxID=479431 RepID=C8X7U2_NAKMY|nr:hypothetical protein [Nakamurella multipartita]ACV80945.1 hypothetical protein Namu_4668 [Nakamurella multipartita DSM 44233]